MKEMTLADINELEDGMPIPQFSGHMRSVFDRKSGVGEHGDWSFQDGLLTDGNTDVRLKFKGMDDMKSLTGKEVTIRANKSPKHGLTGVKKVIEDYQGKSYHKVLLTESCKIVVGLPNGKEESPAEDDLLPMDHDDEGKALVGVTEAKHHIMQAVNLYNLCVDATDTAIKPHIEGMTADLYQAAIGTLFIEASRAGFVAKMPTKPLK